MKSNIPTTLFICLAGSAAIAQEFDLSWHTVDSGGVMKSTGGAFELSGTIGQADAGSMAGGGFELNGGFWFELPPGDCDEDGIANLMDHDPFTQCLGGPAASVLSGCECFDVDRNGSVDLYDFAITTQRY
jgi:hypothetical protein